MAKKISLEPDVIELARYARALSHPVRAYIIRKLSKMNACCYSGNLVDELPIGRSALSQHLKELKHAGLINGETEPPFIKYCIHRENWDTARGLFSDLIADGGSDIKCDEPEK
jgi:ArsR family transcriptional regulator, arsenate/arsenite/antimonite-responsive transcriptional repressor